MSGVLIEPREHGVLQALSIKFNVRANTLAVAVNRWSARLSQLVRDELCETVVDARLVDDEVRAMRSVLRGEN